MDILFEKILEKIKGLKHICNVESMGELFYACHTNVLLESCSSYAMYYFVKTEDGRYVLYCDPFSLIDECFDIIGMISATEAFVAFGANVNTQPAENLRSIADAAVEAIQKTAPKYSLIYESATCIYHEITEEDVDFWIEQLIMFDKEIDAWCASIFTEE